MLYNRHIFPLIIITTLNVAPAAQAQGYRGDRHWMLQPADARSAALGRTGVALTGPAAVRNNPGAAAFQRGAALSYSYDPWLSFLPGLDTRIDAGSAVTSLPKGLTAGVMWRQLRLDQSFNLPDPYIDVGIYEDYRLRHRDIGAFIGWRWRSLGMGMTIRHLADLDEFQPADAGIAVDAGVLYSVSWKKWQGCLWRFSTGLSVLNWGPDLEFGALETIPLPRQWRCGYALELQLPQRQRNLTVFRCMQTLELSDAVAEVSSWDYLSIGTGMELTFYELFSLRGGYYHQRGYLGLDNPESPFSGWTWGAGISSAPFGPRIRLPFVFRYEFARRPFDSRESITGSRYVHAHTISLQYTY